MTPVPPERSPRAGLRAGRVMRGVAVLGVVTALGGAITGWQLLGQIDTTLSDSLEVTTETLTTLEETIVLADDVLGSVDEALGAAEGSLRAVESSTGDAVAVIESVDGLIGELTPSLRNVESTLRDLSGIGRTIDSVLEQLDNIPFGPNYDPERPLGEQLDLLAADIGPVVESLDGAAGPLDGLAGSSGDLNREIAALADAVAAVNTDLQASDVLLDSYLATAQRAQEVAASADTDLGDEVGQTRVFVVLAALLVALGQIVPWWVGTELVRRARRELALVARDEAVQSEGRRPSPTDP